MGKKSVKENKTKYQEKREECNLSRDAASEATHLSSDRIEKIENRGATPYPDEIVAMADAYREPALCNFYCTHECAIGKRFVPEIIMKDLPQTVLEMVVALNKIQDRQTRLMEISMNNAVGDDQIRDFIEIQEELARISLLVETLQFWTEEMLAEGKIDRELYDQIKNSMKK